MERLKKIWNYAKLAFAWLWSAAPQWRKYVVMTVLGVVLTLLARCAFATEPKPAPIDPIKISADADAVAVAKARAAATADATSSSGGNSLSVTEEAGAPPVVLVPNNNTESCLRVFGLGGSNREGSLVFGVPFRSVQCDLEASADDAFAQGNFTLGWMFKCKMKSQIKAFGSEEACLSVTIDEVARQAELVKLNTAVDSLKRQRDELQAENASRFTPVEADERCARKTKAGICAAGK